MWTRSVPQRGSAWLQIGVVDLRSFRKPDPLATRYRAVVLTASKHGVLLLRQGHHGVRNALPEISVAAPRGCIAFDQF